MCQKKKVILFKKVYQAMLHDALPCTAGFAIYAIATSSIKMSKRAITFILQTVAQAQRLHFRVSKIKKS